MPTNALFPNSRDPGATVWDDVTQAAFGRRLYSTSGGVGYDYTENAIEFDSGGSISNLNDRISWSIQFPHAARLDSMMMPHIHFEQTSTNVIEFTHQYRIQSNGTAKTTAWTTATSDTATDAVFTYPGSGTFNQIIRFPSIDMTGKNISATIDFRLARTDATGGVILVKFIDSHVEFDSGGSREEFVK